MRALYPHTELKVDRDGIGLQTGTYGDGPRTTRTSPPSAAATVEERMQLDQFGIMRKSVAFWPTSLRVRLIGAPTCVVQAPAISSSRVAIRVATRRR